MVQTAAIAATVFLWMAAFALMFSNNNKKNTIIELKKENKND